MYPTLIRQCSSLTLQATGYIFVSPVPHKPSGATLPPQPSVPQPSQTRALAQMTPMMMNCPRTSQLPHCVTNGVLLCSEKLKRFPPLRQSSPPLRQSSPPHLSAPPSLMSLTPALHDLAGSVWLTLVQACSVDSLLPPGRLCATDIARETRARLE